MANLTAAHVRARRLKTFTESSGHRVEFEVENKLKGFQQSYKAIGSLIYSIGRSGRLQCSIGDSSGTTF